MKASLFFVGVSFILYSCTPTQQITKVAHKRLFEAEALQRAHIGISIFDPTTNKYWYNYQGDKYFIPASNIKIPTCYAAMKYLGDSLIGLRYAIEGSTIHIEPTADPTFLHKDFKVQPAFSLLHSFSNIVIHKPLFADFLGNGWSWNDFKEGYMAQRSNLPMYGNTVRFTWKGNGTVQTEPSYFDSSVTVSEPLTTGFSMDKPWEENRFILLSGTHTNQQVPFRPNIRTIQLLLADTLKRSVELDVLADEWPLSNLYSQPTDSLLTPMMHRSDNFFAEQSLLMASHACLGRLDEAKMIDTLLKTDFKDLPQAPRWVDGSGLSRYNLFTPQDFIVILNKMSAAFGMERIKTIFPTANEGTLTNYYKGLQGKLFAKTGTLSGVVALSGFLYTDKGKLLLFSILVNNHQGPPSTIRRVVEAFLTEVQSRF